MSVTRRTSKATVIHYEGGVASFVEYLNRKKAVEVIHPDVIYFSATAPDNNSTCEIAMQYTDSYNETDFVLCKQHSHRGRRYARRRLQDAP